jgi:opacity protein-like surface antigen
MRKPLLFALLVAFALPFTAPKAQAQFFLNPYLGYNIEDGFGFLVGIGTEFEAPFEAGNLSLSIRPSIEYVFTDDPPDQSFSGVTITSSTSYIQLNGDVIARLNAEGFNPFVGAGLAIGFISASSECEGSAALCGGVSSAEASDTEIGLNVLGGLEFPGALAIGTPFVQGRLTLIDGSAISILGGLMIPLGAE